VRRLLADSVACEVIALETWGDKNKQVSLLDHPPQDIFTRELDQALLAGEGDIAVHSAKDLPDPLPEGIEVVALLSAADSSDCLVSRNRLPLDALPAGSVVGASSALRQAQLKQQRPDLLCRDLRGTIEERIAKIQSGDLDAVIVATCAMKRLGRENEIAEILPFQTHPLQGVLAVTAKAGRRDLAPLLERLDLRRTGQLRPPGKITLYTGTHPGHYPAQGKRVQHCPMIVVGPLADYQEADRILSDVKKYDWIMFTSQHTVGWFFERLQRLALPASGLAGCRVASIGPATTAALARRGVQPELEPAESSSRGLLALYQSLGIKGAAILLPRSNLAGSFLVEELEQMGNRVTPVILYRTGPPEVFPALDWSSIGEIIFTSPSGVANFVKAYGQVPAGVVCQAIGPETKKALEAAGLALPNGLGR